MDKLIRKAQERVLGITASCAGSFALAGGTALELYYLRHRFSADLDFFSPVYDTAEIEKIKARLEEAVKCRLKLESESIVGGRAKVRFYTMPVKGSARPLKIDFVEDVVIRKPRIRRFHGVPVYSAEDIYLHKIAAVCGTRVFEDEIGRKFMEGRREARDVFDLYVLSKKICALHIFLARLDSPMQIGMVHWERSFSRQDLKLGLLDLDIYVSDFNARAMIIYLENEIRSFIKQVAR